MAKFRACLVSSAVLLAAPAVYAQDFGKSGQFAVGAERLFGLVHSINTEELGDAEVTRSHTNISLLLTPFGSTTATSFPVGYSFPRIGADYFVMDGLSVGGSLGIFAHSGNVETEFMGETEDEDTGSITGFLFQPRVGYAFMFNETLGIWPRGGITFVSFGYEAENNDETSSSAWAITLEAPFVINPVPHVVFGIGPTLDLGVTGSTEVDYAAAGEANVDNDFTMHDIGLQTSLTAYF